MNYFKKDPSNLYKNIKLSIPSLKIKNKIFMNKLHNLNMSSDFWWAISGGYAILAEYANLQSAEDPRFLNDLKNSNVEFSKEKMISSTIINSIGREWLLEKNFDVKSNFLKKNINDILVSIDEKHFSNERRLGNKIEESLPMFYLTNFLTKLRLKNFKFIYFKIKQKIQSIFKKTNHDDEVIANNENNNFDSFLKLLLPDDQTKYFPRWFVFLSYYLVKGKHKWITKFGLGLDIYQTILIAKSYQKFGTQNIKIIPHGVNISTGLWHLYRFSLFPDMKLHVINESLYLPKISKPSFTYDVLFCPMQLPIVCDFFSPSHFWNFMDVYKDAIKLLNEGLKNGKKIKIRYKNFKYMSGYGGPFTHEECKIPVENERFENVYSKYKLIVSMPFGTIAAKCYQNDLDCLTYHYPFVLTDKETYLKIKTFPGVFTERNVFLDELQKKLQKL